MCGSNASFFIIIFILLRLQEQRPTDSESSEDTKQTKAKFHWNYDIMTTIST